MKNPKVIAGLITAALLAFGINLERFGIDLESLLGGNTNVSVNQGANDSGKLNLDQFKSDKSNSKSSQPTSSSSTSSNAKGYAHGPQWSKTTPAVNLWHVFEGEINRKGKPVGFHSRPGGQDPENARIKSVKDGPNSRGVYTANIEIRDGQQWRGKFSSFFPDSLSQEQVIEAVLHAYNNSADKKRQPWQGPSGLGFDVQGYTLSRGDINTAFPIYRKN